MKHTEDSFSGVGDVEIFFQSWLPDGSPKAIVAIAHGVSEHSSRYAHVAEPLVAAGYAVYALDHRGHGRSGGPRAVIDRMDHAVADLGTLIGAARADHADTPLFLLGHSMGGCISLAYATRGGQDTLAGLILSGPAAVLESAGPVVRLLAIALSAVVPKLGVFDIDPEAVSRDPEVVADYVSDPLNHHGKLPARTLAELAGAIEKFPDAIPTLQVPLLIMHGSDDTLVPVSASELVESKASSPDKTLRIYPGLYHEILNEPEQDEIIAEIRDWLETHV